MIVYMIISLAVMKFIFQQIYTFALAGRNFVQGGNPQEETYLLKRYIRSLGGQCRQNIDEKATFLGLVQKGKKNSYPSYDPDYGCHTLLLICNESKSKDFRFKF